MVDKLIEKVMGLFLIAFAIACVFVLYGILRHPPARLEWGKYLLVAIVGVASFLVGVSCVKGGPTPGQKA